MDAFEAAVTATGLVLKFVTACAAYSSDAKSLKARFDWDLRALKAIRDYFVQRQAMSPNNQLTTADTKLLDNTAVYLDWLAERIQRSLRKIETRGLWRPLVNRGMWVTRQTELHAMEEELFRWTQRFDLRVLGLPPELRIVIPSGVSGAARAGPAVGAGPDPGTPRIVRSNDRLRHLCSLSPASREAAAHDIRLPADDADKLANRILAWRDISFLQLDVGDRQLIFASRAVPPAVADCPRALARLQTEMGFLAAALNCLDPDPVAAAQVRLLRVESWFYHAETQRFFFAQPAPFTISGSMTLDDAIKGEPHPAGPGLGQRFRLALRLAESLFFLHTAGFVHKNVTSSSVVALRRPKPAASPDAATPGPLLANLDDLYLMGFNLIRNLEGATHKVDDAGSAAAAPASRDQASTIWHYDIFQHPDRLRGVASPRYTKTHDVYSLGVLLLYVSRWEPLKQVVRGLDGARPSLWTDKLLQVASELGPRTGERYQRLISWCLALDGREIVTEGEFVQNVLDPLEDMVNAIS